jgi:hypothetical protein
MFGEPSVMISFSLSIKPMGLDAVAVVVVSDGDGIDVKVESVGLVGPSVAVVVEIG